MLLALAQLLRAQTTLLFEGFEGQFPADNAWSVGDANPAGFYAYWDDVDLYFGGEGAHSGNWKGYCAGFGYGGSAATPNYQDNMTAFMQKTIDLTGYSAATVRFWHKLPAIENCNGCDLASVWVDGTRVWSDFNPTTTWTETTIDLSAHVGGPRNLRFEFSSDGSVTAEGWYLDDILVTGYTPPPNDSCSGAVTLTSGVPYTMHTGGAASTDDPAPVCQGNFGKGVWFKHVAPASGALAISTCGSGFDTVLQVFEGNCSRLEPVLNGCNDDNGPRCSGAQASAVIAARAGGTYTILVGGYAGQGGSLTIEARDAEPPNLSCPGIIITNTLRTTCERPVAYPITAVDNQDANPLVVCFPPSGTVFPLGTNAVHCMATDAAGNSRSCEFEVVVQDRAAPQFVCPTDIVVPTDIHECRATHVTYSMTATDNCGWAMVDFEPRPPISPTKGVWPITAYAVDDAGNSNFCVFTITVLDLEAPIPQIPGNRTVECGTPWAFTTPAATDNCEGTEVIVSVVSTVTNEMGCGREIIRTWRIADSSGNAIEISQKVTEQDTTPPVLTCATNRVVECGTSWTFDTPIVTDNCDPNVFVRVVGGSTSAGCGGTFTATQIWEARDACGNAATCSQTVSVVDTTPPWFSLLSNHVFYAEGQSCSLPRPGPLVAVSDNCMVSLSCNPWPASFPLGVTVIHCTASDQCGHTTNASFSVTVLQSELRYTPLAGGLFRLDWPEGTLQYGNSVTGPYTDIPYAVPGYTFNAQPGAHFYRTRHPYSSNVVGVIVKELPPGYSLVAHSLLASNSTVAALLAGLPEGVSVFSYPFSKGANNKLAGWNHPGMVLTPGTGCALHNPYPTNGVVRWVGDVFRGHAAVTVRAYDTALLGAVVPQAGGLSAALGWTPYEGDLISTHDATGWRVTLFSLGSWTQGEPFLDFGEAFLYRNPRAVDWTWSRASPFAPWPCGLGTNDWTAFGAYQGFGMSTGTVNFFTFHPQPGLGRVYEADGVTPLASGFSAQLYAGPAGAPEGSLLPVGTPQPFLGGTGAGYLRGTNVIVPHVTAGLPCELQLRVWENAGGNDYESAAVQAVKVGKSAVFTVTLGSDWGRVFPPNANGFPSFRVRGVEPLCSDFEALPVGSMISGSAYVGGDGILHLTDAVNGQQGTFLWAAGRPLGGFRAAFKALVGDSSTAPSADGFSFCFGSDLSPSFGEEGSGTGLIVSFDTFDNGGEDAPCIDLKWNGATFAHTPRRLISQPAAFADVFIELATNGAVTVSHGGSTVFDAVPIPGYFPISHDAWFGLGARTGSLNAKHWIDSLCLNDDASRPRPRLTIARSNATVVVSWPRPAEGWVLEATNALPGVAAPWPQILPPYQTNGANLQFLEPAPVGKRFYRLRRQ
jgi:hypothetical protein